MVSVIAEVLKSSLSDLTWMERFGGIVFPVTKPIFKTLPSGEQAQNGSYTYPAACGVNSENCWEDGTFKYFEPDSSKAAIGFFTDNGGVTLKGLEAPRQELMRFAFDLKFLCWMNTARLGEDITAGGCLPSGRVAPYVIAQLFGAHSAVGLFGGGLEEEVFNQIEVTGIRELVKHSSMFEPFTFAKIGAEKNLFVYPNDYFGLQITGTFAILKNCLPEFGVDWEPFEGCLAPPSGTGTPGNGTSNWFFNQMQIYNNGLGAFPDNETAKAAYEIIYGVGNAVGKEYYISAGSDVQVQGTKMRVW